MKIQKIAIVSMMMGVMGVMGVPAPQHSIIAQASESSSDLFTQILDQKTAQVNDAINIIIPDQSVGEIRLGQTLEFVKSILGEPNYDRNFNEEKQLYLDVGRNTDNQLVFQRGFDRALEYRQDRNQTNYPIFKVYFKDNQLIQIHLSVFMYSEEIAQMVKFTNSNLGLFLEVATMEEVLGTDYQFYTDELGFQTYEYLNQGVSLIFKNGEVVTIVLYEPI